MASCWKEARHVCKVSRCLMIAHSKGGKGERFTICLISYFQILNSVLQHVSWNFCDLFTFNAMASTFMYCLLPLIRVVVAPFSIEQEEKRVKVMADSCLIMRSNTVMRWELSSRRDCTTERFLGVPWEISGRIKNRLGGSGDSLAQREWHVDLVVGRWPSGKFDSDFPLSCDWKIYKWSIFQVLQFIHLTNCFFVKIHLWS